MLKEKVKTNIYDLTQHTQIWLLRILRTSMNYLNYEIVNHKEICVEDKRILEDMLQALKEEIKFRVETLAGYKYPFNEEKLDDIISRFDGEIKVCHPEGKSILFEKHGQSWIKTHFTKDGKVNRDDIEYSDHAVGIILLQILSQDYYLDGEASEFDVKCFKARL